MVENFHKITRIPKTIYPAFGGLVVGLIALAYPEVLYWGFENVDILLESRPFVNGLPAHVLFQLVGVKIVATSLSRASGLVGGYYAPSLFIGAATGMAYGKFMSSALSGPNPLFHLSLLEVASPQAYGLVGMAATLAGVCQVPLTSVLLLFELTQDYRIVLPLLGAVGVSSWIVSSQNKKKDVGNRLSTSGVKEASVNQYKKSIYQGQGLEASTGTSGVTDLCQIESSLCVYDSVGEINQLVEKLTVLQAMRTRYVTVLMSSSLVEAVSLMLVEKQPCAIITDANGFLVELLSLEDIQNFSKVAKKRGTQTEFEKILVSHVCHLVGKKYQARAVTPDTTLATAESIMNSQGVNQLAVVSGHVDGQKKGHLVGLLDRESISVAYRAAATKESLGLSSENL